MNMHRNTLARKLKMLGISHQYSAISDEALDQHILNYRKDHPRSGVRYIIGYLRSLRIRLPRERIRTAVRRIDGVGVRLRTKEPIVRRKYQNPGPNAIWHCDGHLKIGMYGIALHGFIDGYSRKVISSQSFHFHHQLTLFLGGWSESQLSKYSKKCI